MARANQTDPTAPFVAPNGALPAEVVAFLRTPVVEDDDPVFAAVIRDVAERGAGRGMGAAAIRDRRRHADRVAGEVEETRRDLLVRFMAYKQNWSRSVALQRLVVGDEASRKERDTEDSEHRREVARQKRELRMTIRQREDRKRARNDEESERLLEWTTHCPTALLARETAANDSRVDQARSRVRFEDVSAGAPPNGQAERKLDADAPPPKRHRTAGEQALPAPAPSVGVAGLPAPPAASASIAAVPAASASPSPAPAAASASAARAASVVVPFTPSVSGARGGAATKANPVAPSAAPANAAHGAPVSHHGARAATQARLAAAQNSAQVQPSARTVAGAVSTQPVPRRPPAAAALELGLERMDTAA